MIRFTPVPDSVLHSALMTGEKMTSLDARQQVQHFVFMLQFHVVIRDFKIWQRDSNKDN